MAGQNGTLRKFRTTFKHGMQKSQFGKSVQCNFLMRAFLPLRVSLMDGEHYSTVITRLEFVAEIDSGMHME